MPSQELTAQEAAFVKAASGWVGQLARTLKTCRLYDPANPTVLKFRVDLAASLDQLLQEHGSLPLQFSSTDVSWSGIPLHRAYASREDNLGLPFYRDGVRTMTLSAGIDLREVNAIVDALLRATSRTADDCDLVTLLWDAQLDHVNVEYVSTEADADAESGGHEGAATGASLMPWPKSEPQSSGSATSAAAPAADPPGAAPGGPARSDDWAAAEFTGEANEALDDLEAHAPFEIERFRAEHEAELRTGPLAPMLTLLRECMESTTQEGDREDLAHLLPRLLQEAITHASWGDARHALYLLQSCAAVQETVFPGLLDEMAQPSSVVSASAVRELDQQGLSAQQEFLAFAEQLGDEGVGWLMRILAETRRERVRRSLVSVLAELCRESPERLAPWLSDASGAVVRDAVQILGVIGSESTTGLVATVAGHADPLVRQEVIAALEPIDHPAARAVLRGMLGGADSRTFCAVLHPIASRRDPEIARLLMDYLAAPGFHSRPPEERRAVYSGIGSAGDDGVLPELEKELHRGAWLSGPHEEHRRAIARCIARIGTEQARQILEQGARSHSRRVREACTAARTGGSGDD